MTNDSYKAQLQTILDGLVEQEAAIKEEIAPIQAKYDELAAKINELDTEQRPYGTQLKELRTPLFEISRQIRGLKQALGHKELVFPAPGEGSEEPVPEQNEGNSEE